MVKLQQYITRVVKFKICTLHLSDIIPLHNLIVCSPESVSCPLSDNKVFQTSSVIVLARCFLLRPTFKYKTKSSPDALNVVQFTLQTVNMISRNCEFQSFTLKVISIKIFIFTITEMYIER